MPMRWAKATSTPRLTLDITPAMRARIKVSAFTQGVTVADLLRGLLEREFPRRTHHERIRLACRERGTGCAAACAFGTRRPGRQRAADARFAGLHRTSLQALPALRRTGAHAQLDRWRRCAVFLPGAMLCRIRWQANDYGTIRWQLMVMQACTPLDAAQRIPGVQPGARCCCTPKAMPTCAPCWSASTASRRWASRHRRVARVLAHAGQPAAARLALPEYTAERHAAWLAGKVLP
jgi:hypothetical protein